MAFHSLDTFSVRLLLDPHLAQRLTLPVEALAPGMAAQQATDAVEAAETAPPLFAMMAPSGASRAPVLRMSRKAVIAARRRATR